MDTGLTFAYRYSPGNEADPDALCLRKGREFVEKGRDTFLNSGLKIAGLTMAESSEQQLERFCQTCSFGYLTQSWFSRNLWGEQNIHWFKSKWLWSKSGLAAHLTQTHLAAMRPWTTHVPILSSSFHIYKMGIRILLTHKVTMRIHGNSI